MKNIILVSVIFVMGAFSSTSFAKDVVQKRKVTVISFENDSKSRLPASADEKAVIAAQSRHVAQMRSLDQAILNLD